MADTQQPMDGHEHGADEASATAGPDEQMALEVISELDAEFAELEQEIARIGALPQAGAPEKVAMLEALRAKWKMRNLARKPDEDRPQWRKNIDGALELAIGEILDDQAVDIDGNLAFTLETDTVQRHAPKVMQALAAGLGEAMTSGTALGGNPGEPETGAQQLMRQLLAGFGTAMGQALKPVAAQAVQASKPTGKSRQQTQTAPEPEASGSSQADSDKGQSCEPGAGPQSAASPAPPENPDGAAQAAPDAQASSSPAQTSVTASGPARDLLTEALDLEALSVAAGGSPRFEALAPVDGRQRLFGGTFLGQALRAACTTVDMTDRVPHGLHAHFLRAGDPALPLRYEVETLLDGASFSTRQVRGHQDGQLIFLATASFHVPEPGLAHQVTMPQTPPPGGFPTFPQRLEECLERAPSKLIFRAMARQPQLFERRDVDPVDLLEPQPRQGLKRFWFRAALPLADDLGLHYGALAWASDIGLLTHSGEVHGLSLVDPRISAASLDHAVWFHRPFRADNWLLYVSESPSADAGRGFNTGRIFARDGALVASVAQEGLLRVKNPERA